ncbi:MAG: hypothetical protein ACTSVK_16495 [Promethearchaeota archaeon]
MVLRTLHIIKKFNDYLNRETYEDLDDLFDDVDLFKKFEFMDYKKLKGNQIDSLIKFIEEKCEILIEIFNDLKSYDLNDKYIMALYFNFNQMYISLNSNIDFYENIYVQIIGILLLKELELVSDDEIEFYNDALNNNSDLYRSLTNIDSKIEEILIELRKRIYKKGLNNINKIYEQFPAFNEDFFKIYDFNRTFFFIYMYKINSLFLKIRYELNNSSFANFLDGQVNELINKNRIDQNNLTDIYKTNILKPLCQLLGINYQFDANLQGIPSDLINEIKNFFDSKSKNKYFTTYTKKFIDFGYFCYNSFRNEIAHNKFANIFILRLKSLLILYELVINYLIISFVSSV